MAAHPGGSRRRAAADAGGQPRLTAFVREVLLPDAPDAVPRVDRRACAYALGHAASPIHRWGIFARQDIPARRRVIEYTGQRIDAQEARRRSIRRHLYLFWIDPRRAIDGGIGGSGAEFINHSCEPNLRASLRRGRIFLVSLRPIAAGEELTLDYQIVGEVTDASCRCGAPRCRGSMRRPERES